MAPSNMAPSNEVGLFIDFENIRYGLLNNFGVEPDPTELMEKARKYGPVAVAYAYADFTQHPPIYRRKLEVAGIMPRDVPRRSPDVPHKSSADMAMLMDIIDCLLDRPSVNTLVLMTGDSDFIRVTARARHRFGKQVVISGVPGSVSTDLVESADLYDPLADDTPEPIEAANESDHSDEISLVQLIVWLDDNRPYMTFGFIRSHALSPHHELGLTEDRVTELLTSFKERQVLLESYRTTDDGRTLRTLELNVTDALVQEAKTLPGPHFEDAPARNDRNGRGAKGDDGSDEGDRTDGLDRTDEADRTDGSDGSHRGDAELVELVSSEATTPSDPGASGSTDGDRDATAAAGADPDPRTTSS